MTDLDCSPSYEPNTENNDNDYIIIDEFLYGNYAITIKELCEKFMQANSDVDMKIVKLVMLYLLSRCYLERKIEII